MFGGERSFVIKEPGVACVLCCRLCAWLFAWLWLAAVSGLVMALAKGLLSGLVLDSGMLPLDFYCASVSGLILLFSIHLFSSRR